jgi:LuxR family maltose regulon positive regulatory protein
MAEAIQHTLQAGDTERAVHLVEQIAPALLRRGEILTLLRWLERLPDKLIRLRPQLGITYAWALVLNGQLAQAEQWLQNVLQIESDPAIMGQAAAIRAFQTILQGDIEAAQTFSQQALELLPEATPLAQGVARLTTGISDMLQGDVVAAIRIFSEMADYSQASGNIMMAALALGQVAENYKVRGQLRRSAELYRQALALVTTPEGQALPGAGMIHAGLGVLAYEWNELAAAQAHLDKSLEFGRLLGQTGTIDSYILQFWLKQAGDDLAGAQEVIRQAGQIIQTITPLGQPLLEALQVRLWLVQGNLAAATDWVVYRRYLAAQTQEPDPALPYMIEELQQLALARLLIALGRANPAGSALQAASARLEATRQAAERLGRLSSVIETWLLQALAYQAQGHLPQALSALTQALALTEPEGHLRLFIDEGPPLAELLFLLKKQQITINQAYLDKLLTAFTSSSLDEPAEIQNPKSKIQNLVESLSDRELEILRLIAAGHSNEEIAQTLIIALGTVKKHVNNIYGKLGVHSRTQALVRARELELL